MKRVKELFRDVKWFVVALYAAAFVRDKGELKSGKVEKFRNSGFRVERGTRNAQHSTFQPFNLSTGTEVRHEAQQALG